MGCVLGVIPILRRRILRAMRLHGRGVSDRAADDFRDEAAGERRQVRQDEGAVLVRRELRQRNGVVEVVHGHGGQSGDDDVVVREVCVEGAPEGEVGGVVVEGGVDGGVGGGDVFVLQAGEELLHVSDALGAAGGVAKGVVVVV